MITMDEKDLARRLTSFYDALLLPWIRLRGAGKLTKGEEDLLWAFHRQWAGWLDELGVNNVGASHPARGDGEWGVILDSSGKSLYEAMK